MNAAGAAGPGYVLPSRVTIVEADAVMAQAAAAFSVGAGAWTVDAGQLQSFDSACLAVLLELRRRAGAQALRCTHVPARLRQLAQAYGLDFMFEPEQAS